MGSQEAPEAASMEIWNLLEDYEKYSSRMDDLMARIEEKIKEVPYVDKLLEIKGIGLKTGMWIYRRGRRPEQFDDPKQLQKLAGYAIVKNSSGKHAGESHISYRGRKRLRYVLYEAAISVIGKNGEFREIHRYYQTREKNPLKKMQSVVAIACKVLRVFYAILQKV